MTRSAIGTLNEAPLHASLKEWYAEPGDRFEVAVDGFVVDIVRDGVLIEIQGGHFASIKSKLERLVDAHRVRLVHPVAVERWIVKREADGGDGVTRRKSPRRGQIEDLFCELVSLPDLLAHPNVSLEVLMTREEEVRRYEGRRRYRRKGWAIEERRLLDVLERRRFEQPADWRALVPGELQGTFTARGLAAATGITRPLAQKMAYCLRKVGVVELVGKEGRAHLYEVASR